MSDQDVHTWVLDRVDERVEPDPDGLQNVHSNVWTSRDQLKDDGRKSTTPFTKAEVVGAIDELDGQGELIDWFGLLAPTTDDHLRAIIESERKADVTRAILVGKCNELRSNDKSGKHETS